MEGRGRVGVRRFLSEIEIEFFLVKSEFAYHQQDQFLVVISLDGLILLKGNSKRPHDLPVIVNPQ